MVPSTLDMEPSTLDKYSGSLAHTLQNRTTGSLFREEVQAHLLCVSFHVVTKVLRVF